jgi:hypothetical protein
LTVSVDDIVEEIGAFGSHVVATQAITGISGHLFLDITPVCGIGRRVRREKQTE